MSDVTNINDLHLFQLKVSGESLVLLRDEDHLLRRFGQVEFRRFSEKQNSEFIIRAVADEIWSCIFGAIEFTLVDLRPASPSENIAKRLTLHTENPQGLLIPFGVAYSIQADENAQAIRVTTHVDGVHNDDKIIASEDLSEITSNL